jgi:hypothetical protein
MVSRIQTILEIQLHCSQHVLGSAGRWSREGGPYPKPMQPRPWPRDWQASQRMVNLGVARSMPQLPRKVRLFLPCHKLVGDGC